MVQVQKLLDLPEKDLDKLATKYDINPGAYMSRYQLAKAMQHKITPAILKLATIKSLKAASLKRSKLQGPPKLSVTLTE